jgi:hypothetical protein
MQDPMARLGLALSVLWTPETAGMTFMTLAPTGIASAGNSLARAAGPLKQWIRVGPSYSVAMGENVSMSVRWGASMANNGKFLKQIPSDNFKIMNQWLRAKQIPFGGWRSVDPGHFHLWIRI